jgi:hypothetical protein
VPSASRHTRTVPSLLPLTMTGVPSAAPHRQRVHRVVVVPAVVVPAVVLVVLVTATAFTLSV